MDDSGSTQATTMLTTESLLVVLLLLPGFLAGRVLSLVAVQRRRNALEQFGEVVLFEFLVMCVYGAGSDYLGWPALIWPDSEAIGSRTADILRDNAPALSSLLGISILSGVGIGRMHNTDQPLTLLRHFGMTKQSTHATVCQGTLYSQSDWMIVHLASGERVIGWPAQFSDTPEEGALFLTQAAFVGGGRPIDRDQGSGHSSHQGSRDPDGRVPRREVRVEPMNMSDDDGAGGPTSKSSKPRSDKIPEKVIKEGKNPPPKGRRPPPTPYPWGVKEKPE